MIIAILEGQAMKPCFTVRVELNFGNSKVRLPTMHIEADTLTAVANALKTKSDGISAVLPRAHLRIISIEAGRVNYATHSNEADPLTALGTMMAVFFIDWLKQ